jgi:hypothetical protein
LSISAGGVIGSSSSLLRGKCGCVFAQLVLRICPRPPSIPICFSRLIAFLQSVFYSQSTRTQNRPVTHQAHLAHLQTHPSPIRSIHPYRTRLRAATNMPLEYIIGNPPTIVSLRRQAVCSWAQCRPNKCLVKFLPVSQDAPPCPDSKGAS